MIPPSTKPLHSTARIAVGALLLLPLWYIEGALGWYSTVGREVLFSLLVAAVAGPAVVFLFPVLIRGDWVQRVLALVLLAFPLLLLICAFLENLEYYL
jgi:hypothetical protein